MRWGEFKHGRLTAAEELVLAERRKAGDLAARDELVLSNLAFGVYVASELVHRKTWLQYGEDVRQAAYVGLIVAADRYDPAAHANVRFGTYAAYLIRLEVMRFLESLLMVRTPHYAHSSEGARRLQHADPRAIPGMLKTREQATRAKQGHVSLDVRDSDPHAEPVAPDDGSRQLAELAEDIRAKLAALRPRERDVLERHNGIGRPAQTYRQIGADLGIAHEHARHAALWGMQRMREAMRK